MAFTRRETTILALGDFLILVASLWVALAIRNFELPSKGYFAENFFPFLPVFLLSIFVFYIAGLYEKQTRIVKREMGERIFGAQIANSAIAVLLFFALPLSIAPKTILLLYMIVSVVGVSSWRVSRARYERRSEKADQAVLIAEGSAANELFDEVNGNTRYLFSFLKRIEPQGKAIEEIVAEVAEATAHGARIAVIDSRAPAITPALPHLYKVVVEGVSFIEFSSFYEDVFDRVPLDHVDHAWLLESLPKRPTLYDAAKRAFDLFGACACLLVATPIVLVAATLLKVRGDSAFIWSERVGKGGKLVRLPKLRTMLIDDRGDPELRKQNRVTPLGKILRKTRIDELPQLWSVLMGALSFIGPRPELPSLVEVYSREIPYYQARHLITPGLSGWAQIRDYDAPRGGADVERTRRKLSYDLYYLKHRSFGLDVAIALKTFRALLSFSGT